jgi:hypothetical protein
MKKLVGIETYLISALIHYHRRENTKLYLGLSKKYGIGFGWAIRYILAGTKLGTEYITTYLDDRQVEYVKEILKLSQDDRFEVGGLMLFNSIQKDILDVIVEKLED